MKVRPSHPTPALPELVEGLSLMRAPQKKKGSPSTSSGWAGNRVMVAADSPEAAAPSPAGMKQAFDEFAAATPLTGAEPCLNPRVLALST
jgi:hypothetical protein